MSNIYEPTWRFELQTYGLRYRCSTIELSRLIACEDRCRTKIYHKKRPLKRSFALALKCLQNSGLLEKLLANCFLVATTIDKFCIACREHGHADTLNIETIFFVNKLADIFRAITLIKYHSDKSYNFLCHSNLLAFLLNFSAYVSMQIDV